MKRFYRKFNSVCVLLILFFALGAAWEWRGVFMEHGTWNMEQVSTERDITTQQHINTTTLNTQLTNQKSKIEKLVPSSSRDLKSKIDDVVTDRGSLNVVLPARVNLPVPFTSQAPEKNWDQPWQDACEEAAILMLDAYYKKYGLSPLFAKDELLKMIAWEEEQGWGRSVEIEKIKEIMEDYLGYKKLQDPNNKYQTNSQIPNSLTVIVDPTVEQMKGSVVAGHPVLVVADGKALPNTHFRNGGPVYHALIIRGYTEDSFITNDPGTQFGENYAYKYEDLMNAVRDWNGGDVKSGRRVVFTLFE